MTRGIVYYNVGSRCLVRLLVSLGSLRKYYTGDVTILAEGLESYERCYQIGCALSANVIRWEPCLPKGKNGIYLAKTRYHHGTPYDTTIAIDADTLVVGRVDELFDEACVGQFCVARFADWESGAGVIAKRIRAWKEWRPDDIHPALAFGPAINCGVIAFQRNSLFYKDWLSLALPGRDTFIPDEVCCQLSLHRYPHRILGTHWNTSCKYGTPMKSDTRIIHFHGGKHCRIGLPYHGNLWMSELERLLVENVANVKSWMPAGDRVLTTFLRSL